MQSFEKREPVQNSAAQKREWELTRLEIALSPEIEEGGRGWELQKEMREGQADGLEAVVSRYCFLGFETQVEGQYC